MIMQRRSMPGRPAAKRKAQREPEPKRVVHPKPKPKPKPSSITTPSGFERSAKLILNDWVQERNPAKAAKPSATKAKSNKGGIRSKASKPFAENPDDRMVRRTYHLICNLLDANGQAILLEMLKASKRRYKNRHSIDDKPFTQALLLMSWWVEGGGPLLADGSRRKDLSDAMAYADRHGVPNKYVNGFIKQAGLNKISAKLKANHFEPGFGPTSQKRGIDRSA